MNDLYFYIFVCRYVRTKGCRRDGAWSTPYSVDNVEYDSSASHMMTGKKQR